VAGTTTGDKPKEFAGKMEKKAGNVQKGISDPCGRDLSDLADKPNAARVMSFA
jgi:uncharacterized protein YjbJ (UPF0337 family)